jgi:hypothetical protein
MVGAAGCGYIQRGLISKLLLWVLLVLLLAVLDAPAAACRVIVHITCAGV